MTYPSGRRFGGQWPLTRVRCDQHGHLLPVSVLLRLELADLFPRLEQKPLLQPPSAIATRT